MNRTRYQRDRRAAERGTVAMQFQAPAPTGRQITPESHPMLWGIAQAVADGNVTSMAGLGQREADQVRSWAKQIQREQGRVQ